MRTSSTLLSFLAVTCLALGCQKRTEGRFSLAIFARWPRELARSDALRDRFLKRWRHTEVEVEDSEGRKERLQFPPGRDLRSKACGELSLDKAGEFEVTLRLKSAHEVLFEGRKRVRVEKEENRAEIPLTVK